ncbi:MAG: trypsin-like peptidase domain-containing protein [Saprospiraceae bacterium]
MSELNHAIDVYLDQIRALLEAGNVEEALLAIRNLDERTGSGVWKDVTIVSGNFHNAKKAFDKQLIDFKEFQMQSAKAQNALASLMDDIQRRALRDAKRHNVESLNFEVPTGQEFEKMIGSRENLVSAGWFENAIRAMRPVCRIVRSDGELGTGFLTRDGYIFTNNHVLPSAEKARDARVEFNYETDAQGVTRSRVSYEIDPSDFVTSDKHELDFSRIKPIDRADAPLSQWGYVEFDTEAIPAKGDYLTIVQHPLGGEKKIGLRGDETIGVWKHYVFYTTHTEPGSSGSPVFNQNWKVVALHHAGRTDAEGGLQINEQGERRGANRGILFRNIFAYLGNSNLHSPARGDAQGAESAKGFDPSPTPAPIPTPTPNPAPSPGPPMAARSGPLKFVLAYDVADADGAKRLQKHLNVLKLQKKIALYDVHADLKSGDVMAEAQAQMADADYLLILVSADFLGSDWLGLALQAQEGRKPPIIPIRLNEAVLDYTGLEKLRTLPTLNRVISQFPNPDAGFLDVVNELRRLLPT